MRLTKWLYGRIHKQNDEQEFGMWEIDVIKKLAAYEDAEERGLLVRLPCKAGNYVYVHDGFEIFQCLVDRVSFARGFEEIVVILPDRLRFGYKFEAIGKTVFLTREEAEAALKGET